ncbi:MAG: DUF447 family protein [Planctomycetota bacterium]|nr:DUF447 family protein [Planctomycetota bacterium]
MILEGILTTQSADDRMHVSPIGPHVDRSLETWVLKPFKSSTTFSNLHRSDRAVFHIVDDALLLVQAVLGICNTQDGSPAADYRPSVGWVLRGACRAIPLQIDQWDLSQERASANCRAGRCIEIRPFWGWNRAAHSLVELAVVWSRRDLVEQAFLDAEFERHRIVIQKTAGDRELQALALLERSLTDRSKA